MWARRIITRTLQYAEISNLFASQPLVGLLWSAGVFSVESIMGYNLAKS